MLLKLILKKKDESLDWIFCLRRRLRFGLV